MLNRRNSLAKPEVVCYRDPQGDTAYEARRLARNRTNIHTAHRVLGLVERAYAAQFETPGFRSPAGTVPPGTMNQRFSPINEETVYGQLRRMRRAMDEAGSVYWMVTVVSGSEDFTSGLPPLCDPLIALAKVSPSRGTRLQKLLSGTPLDRPNCFLNDIIANPGWQNGAAGVHAGSLALHAALKFSGFRRDRVLALDSFVGNQEPNAWFERLGLDAVPGAEVPPFEAGNGVVLPLERRSSRPGYDLGRHIAYLEETHPMLASAEVA